AILVHRLAVDVVVAEGDRASRFGRFQRNRQKAPLHAVKTMNVLVLAGRAAGMLVARRSGRELVQARLGMDRMVLPVPIAAHYEEAFGHVSGQPSAQLVPFVLKTVIGMIVVLLGAIGTDQRRRTHEDLPRGRALGDGPLEPRLLLLTP